MAEGRYHWSNCARQAQFIRIHYIGSVPWLILLLHPSLNTLFFALGVTALLVYVEVVKKMTVRAFFRSLLLRLTGRVKSTGNLARAIGR